jgi:ABC-type multidrug transport system ATPase subunit
MSAHTLEIEGLTKSFQGKRAVDGVNMSVTRGEIVGFLGPNGAGKTTVMSIATGLLAPDGGRVSLFGVDGGARRSDIRLRLGYLQEKPRIYPDMAARTYLLLFARIYGVPSAQDRVSKLLERVGLSSAADRPLGTFSRGMQQRACLARVMLHEPEFLILDEPTLGLDPTGVADLRTIFREMRDQGTTLLFSSHQLAEMERICDSVIFLFDGRVVAQGRPADLLPGAAGDVAMSVELFESVHPVLSLIRSLPAVQAARETDTHRVEITLRPEASRGERDRRAELSRHLTGAGLTVLSVGAASRTLEDVFLTLTSDGRASAPH